MAGGVGSRFWPMSTAEKPKQFIDVLGVGKTLIQLTVERFGDLVSPENVWVVTNQKYAPIVEEQLPDIPKTNILCEPCRRNTAPCIAYVSWRIKSNDPKANIVVTPSDHIVMDTAEFQRVIKECMRFTSETDAIVPEDQLNDKISEYAEYIKIVIIGLLILACIYFGVKHYLKKQKMQA